MAAEPAVVRGRGGMVDAGDLKSPELCSCGFESRRPHQIVHRVLSAVGAYHHLVSYVPAIAGDGPLPELGRAT